MDGYIGATGRIKLKNEITAEEYRALIERPERKFPKSGLGRGWGTAKKKTVNWHGVDVVFPSHLEAHVAARLLAEEAATPGARLYRQVTIPLLTITPRTAGIPLRFTVDFLMVYPDGRRLYIEAKGKLRSRDFPIRFTAAQASIGQEIRIIEK